MEGTGNEQPPLWDTASPEVAARLTIAINRFNEALAACKRQAKTERELEQTLREVEALPTIPPTR